jgi:dTDP-4-amino-4,6-dideoxygalactose transaminase
MNEPSTNPYTSVIDLENRIAEWSGAKYGIATDSGTSAIFLSLMFRKMKTGSIGEVSIPCYTYPSTACSIIHAGGKVKFEDWNWQGVYELRPLNIIDGALRFKKGMYNGGLHCLSFHVKKILCVGRGGMILTDDIEARDWLRKARFDGRNPIPLLEDSLEMIGWNCYLTPEQASRAIQLFEVLRQRHPNGVEDLKVEDQGYSDLSRFPIYQ